MTFKNSCRSRATLSGFSSIAANWSRAGPVVRLDCSNRLWALFRRAGNSGVGGDRPPPPPPPPSPPAAENGLPRLLLCALSPLPSRRCPPMLRPPMLRPPVLRPPVLRPPVLRPSCCCPPTDAPDAAAAPGAWVLGVVVAVLEAPSSARSTSEGNPEPGRLAWEERENKWAPWGRSGRGMRWLRVTSSSSSLEFNCDSVRMEVSATWGHARPHKHNEERTQRAGKQPQTKKTHNTM